MNITLIPPIYEILDRLEHAGSLIAGMSSVSPTIACICEGDRLDNCIDVLSTYVPKERIVETKAENNGITTEAEDGLLAKLAAVWRSIDTFETNATTSKCVLSLLQNRRDVARVPVF